MNKKWCFLVASFFAVFELNAQVPDCVFRDPLDGYNFRYADAAHIHPSPEQLRQTLDRVNAHIQVEANTPDHQKRREANGEFKRSYCLFHPAGEGGRAILGTVILFHGFSNRPEQMSKLAAYLFHSGYNVYNVFLAQHYKTPGAHFWPKLHYRFDVLHNFSNNGVNPEFAQKVFRIYENPQSEEFGQVFETGPRDADGLSHDGWLNDAKQRLADLDAIPGPVYLVGLSLGSAVALRLGAEDGGRRIKGIVAHGPYLQENKQDRRNQIKLFGPLANQNGNLNGQLFNVASAAAQHLLANGLFTQQSIDNLSKIPTWLVGTESDVSADTGRSFELHSRLAARAEQRSRDEQAPRVAHQWFSYSRDAAVGHAMTDPRDYPEPQIHADQGGGRNYRYKALYQETSKFLLRNEIDEFNLYQFGQNPALPEVRFIFDSY